MALFPNLTIPKPVSDGDTPDSKNGGSGYQWIVNRFVELCDHIADIKEQTKLSSDKEEYRKRIMTTVVVGTTGTLKLDPVPVGSEWRIERILATVTGALATTIVDVFQNGSMTFDQLVSSIPVSQVSSLGFVGEKGYEPNILLRAGEELSLAVSHAEAAATVNVIVWMRVQTEKPQGVAVG